jgi:hypothetical protein
LPLRKLIVFGYLKIILKNIEEKVIFHYNI